MRACRIKAAYQGELAAYWPQWEYAAYQGTSRIKARISRISGEKTHIGLGCRLLACSAYKLQIAAASPDPQTHAFPGTEFSQRTRSPKLRSWSRWHAASFQKLNMQKFSRQILDYDITYHDTITIAHCIITYYVKPSYMLYWYITTAYVPREVVRLLFVLGWYF